MPCAPRIILWDWDNTLVDTWPVIHQSLNVTLQYMGHAPWSLEQVKRDVKHSMRDSFPALFGNRWQEAAEHYQQSYRAVHLQSLTPLDGAEASLLLARERGIRMVVVSNKRGPSLRAEADALGWSKYFDALVGAQDAERDKPDAAPARIALQSLAAVADNERWFIGDSGVDLACAAAIDATAVLYGDHAVEGNRFEGHAFSMHARHHGELQRILAECFANALAG